MLSPSGRARHFMTESWPRPPARAEWDRHPGRPRIGAVALCGALALWSSSRSAAAADCAVSSYYPTAREVDPAIAEGDALVAKGRWADARAVYMWVLARSEESPDALYGLGRVDAWGGCRALAEKEFRQVLKGHPTNADVRAAYVDLLMWAHRIPEAESVLADGLALGPKEPGLLARAARFEFWRGNAAEAARLADEAEAVAPTDEELQDMRARMFLGEARLATHIDHYPPGYQDLFTVSATGLQHVGRFEISGGAEVLERFGGDVNAITDAQYPLSVAYHPAMGFTVGAEGTFGAPAHAIPRLALKTWALAPITGPVDATLGYWFWHYDSGEIVHIFAPEVGIDLPAEVRLDLRGYVSVVTLPAAGGQPGQTQVAGAAGAQVTWSVTPRLDVGGIYTYGAEVDQGQTLYQLQKVKAHVATGFADILLDRRFGLRPVVAVWRQSPDVGDVTWIVSAELGAYTRW